MEEMIKTLDDLPLNQKGYIKQLNCIGSVKRRMLDLGIVEGTQIIPVLKSPSKELRAFEIRGAIIAIRKEEAKLIEVKL